MPQSTEASGSLRNGPKPPRCAPALTGITPQAQAYVAVTGAGITPIGSACQEVRASSRARRPVWWAHPARATPRLSDPAGDRRHEGFHGPVGVVIAASGSLVAR